MGEGRKRLWAFSRGVGVIALGAALLALIRLVLDQLIPVLIARNIIGRGDQDPRDHILQLIASGMSVVVPSVLTVLIAGRFRLITPVKLRVGSKTLKVWAAGFLGANFPILALLGAALALGMTSVVTGPPWDALTNLGFLSLALVILIATAASEEIVFRGAIQPQLAKGLGTPVALLSTSVLFAYAHMEMSPDWLAIRFLWVWR